MLFIYKKYLYHSAAECSVLIGRMCWLIFVMAPAALAAYSNPSILPSYLTYVTAWWGTTHRISYLLSDNKGIRIHYRFYSNTLHRDLLETLNNGNKNNAVIGK